MTAVRIEPPTEDSPSSSPERECLTGMHSPTDSLNNHAHHKSASANTPAEQSPTELSDGKTSSVVNGPGVATNKCVQPVAGLPARTGNAFCPHIPETPRYLTIQSPSTITIDEPLIVQDPALVSSMRVHDALRMQRPSSVLNRKVYDAVEGDSPLLEVKLHNGKAEEILAQQLESKPYASRIEDSKEGVSTSETLSRQSSPPLLKPYYTPKDENDLTLLFESRFESGNLCRAIQVYDFEYDLVLRPDINTNRHTQWYYFRISNTRKGHSYKLNIINMMKCESLYEQGLKILAFSEQRYAESFSEANRDENGSNIGAGWYHTGERIAYYQNNIRRPNGQYYYTLTFTIDSDYDYDNIYIAHSYPYSYSELQYYLRALEDDPMKSRYLRRKLLCETLAGNNCDLLTITNFENLGGGGGSTSTPSIKNRRGVVVTGRVHPGESNASWMMKGVIDFLVSSRPEARRLRDNFIFKIVPMLNPDGVINGNYRCSLARVDLNRIWNDPCRVRHPTVYHTKEMIRRLATERPIVLYADLHGHSQKKNIFMYGCERKGAGGHGGGINGLAGLVNHGSGIDSGVNCINSGMSSITGGKGNGEFGGVHPALARRLHERVFPWLLHHNAPTLFSFEDCNFKIQKCKETTARVVVWREFQLCNSFTLEASFAGSSVSSRHFTQKCLQEMGKALCVTILQYCGVDDNDIAVNAAYRDLEAMWRSTTASTAKKRKDTSILLSLPSASSAIAASATAVMNASASTTSAQESLLFDSDNSDRESDSSSDGDIDDEIEGVHEQADDEVIEEVNEEVVEDVLEDVNEEISTSYNNVNSIADACTDATDVQYLATKTAPRRTTKNLLDMTSTNASRACDTAIIGAVSDNFVSGRRRRLSKRRPSALVTQQALSAGAVVQTSSSSSSGGSRTNSRRKQ